MKRGAVVATQLEGDSFVEGLGQDHVARVLLMNISIQFKTKISMAVTVAVTFSTTESISASPLQAVKDPKRKKCHYVLIFAGQEKHFDHLETIFTPSLIGGIEKSLFSSSSKALSRAGKKLILIQTHMRLCS